MKNPKKSYSRPWSLSNKNKMSTAVLATTSRRKPAIQTHRRQNGRRIQSLAVCQKRTSGLFTVLRSFWALGTSVLLGLLRRLPILTSSLRSSRFHARRLKKIWTFWSKNFPFCYPLITQTSLSFSRHTLTTNTSTL